jgi:hypothetical protein
MKLVYTHENPLLVGNVQNLIEQAGIALSLKNQFASSAVGELSAFDSWPEIWVVNDADYARAAEIVASALSASNAPEWTCPQCQELNDAAFEHCWNCQSDAVESKS